MSPVLLARLLFVLVICPWYSFGLQGLQAAGQEKQFDPYPDPKGGFCQRNQNPAGLGFIGVKYDLLRGNPEGKTSLGGVDPGFDVTRKIFKLTTESGNKVPDQICYEPRKSCSKSKSSKVFCGTKSYQDKLNVDVSASGKLLKMLCLVDVK